MKDGDYVKIKTPSLERPQRRGFLLKHGYDRPGRCHAYFLVLTGALAVEGLFAAGFFAGVFTFAFGAALAAEGFFAAGFFAGAFAFAFGAALAAGLAGAFAFAFGAALAAGLAGAFAFAATGLTAFAGAFATASRVFFFALSAAALPFAMPILQQSISAMSSPMSSTVTIRPQTSQLNTSPFFDFTIARSSSKIIIF
jgi:hypothetical protein